MIRSLTGRLLVAVLCIEFALAAIVTMTAIFYQGRESRHAFDVMLRGHADSILGAVQDADNPNDDVILETTSFSTPPQDYYEVREENGNYLGSSAPQHDLLSSQLSAASQEDAHRGRRLRLGRLEYRAIVVHGVRLIDPEEVNPHSGNKGVLHHIVVYYASPTKPIHEAVWRAARFFLLVDSLALLVSFGAVAFLIKRSLQPLDALAAQASAITPLSWNFNAPASAYQLTELAPLASALDTALHGLERAFQQQQNFLGDAAHELKTAVTVLKSSLQLLTFRDRTRDQYQAGIEGCLADCGRMEELVQRMLLLARLEQAPASGSSVDAPRLPLGSIVQRTLAQLDSAASLRGIRLAFSISDDRSVSLSEEDCVILLTNLVMNAIQHSAAGAKVEISVPSQDSSQLLLRIEDHGEGIADEHLPFIFERFYRADVSRSRDTGGSGLGLAICKAIVHAHGGTIQIESRLGQGTIVSLLLPARPAETASTLTEVEQQVSIGG